MQAADIPTGKRTQKDFQSILAFESFHRTKFNPNWNKNKVTLLFLARQLSDDCYHDWKRKNKGKSYSDFEIWYDKKAPPIPTAKFGIATPLSGDPIYRDDLVTFTGNYATEEQMKSMPRSKSAGDLVSIQKPKRPRAKPEGKPEGSKKKSRASKAKDEKEPAPASSWSSEPEDADTIKKVWAKSLVKGKSTVVPPKPIEKRPKIVVKKKSTEDPSKADFLKSLSATPSHTPSDLPLSENRQTEVKSSHQDGTSNDPEVIATSEAKKPFVEGTSNDPGVLKTSKAKEPVTEIVGRSIPIVECLKISDFGKKSTVDGDREEKVVPSPISDIDKHEGNISSLPTPRSTTLLADLEALENAMQFSFSSSEEDVDEDIAIVEPPSKPILSDSEFEKVNKARNLVTKVMKAKNMALLAHEGLKEFMDALHILKGVAVLNSDEIKNLELFIAEAPRMVREYNLAGEDYESASAVLTEITISGNDLEVRKKKLSSESDALNAQTAQAKQILAEIMAKEEELRILREKFDELADPKILQTKKLELTRAYQEWKADNHKFKVIKKQEISSSKKKKNAEATMTSVIETWDSLISHYSPLE